MKVSDCAWLHDPGVLNVDLGKCVRRGGPKRGGSQLLGLACRTATRGCTPNLKPPRRVGVALTSLGAGVRLLWPAAVLSTQLEAKAEAAAETSSPELVDSTNVHLDKPAPNLHAWVGTRQAVIKVWSKDGSVFELPTAGFQRVATIPGDPSNAVQVHVNLDDAVVSFVQRVRDYHQHCSSCIYPC